MTTATEYRVMAEECFQWAREATTDKTRSAYLEIAKIWLAVAAVRQDREIRKRLAVHARGTGVDEV